MKTFQKAAVGGAMLLATMGGGALGASLINGTAGAASNPSTTATTAPATTSATPDADHDGGRGGPHEANGITETALTGDTLAKATAAAQKAVPGATVERAETDAEGAKYEVHMTKSDGSDVTVKLDASFKVTETLDGHG